MEPLPINALAYLFSGSIFFLLAAIYAVQAHKRLIHWSLPAGCVANTLWLYNTGLDIQWQGSSSTITLGAELLRYLIWILALSANLRFILDKPLPLPIKRLAYGSIAFTVIMIGLHISMDITEKNTLLSLAFSGLILATLALISSEQLYKNVGESRQIKLLCLNVNALFIFDIYFFTDSLMFAAIDPDLWQIRGVIAVAAATIITIGALVLKPSSQGSASLNLSRPIIFYSTSLVAAGILIILLAIGGYYVRDLGGSWSNVVYTLFLFTTLIAITIALLSKTAREFISVLITKHFFSHKYDYRTEWLNLIHRLSQPAMAEQTNTRAFSAIQDIVKSTGGAMWLKDGDQYLPSYQQYLAIDFPLPNEMSSSDFCTILRKQEWIFSVSSSGNSNDAKYNEYLPKWIQDIPKIWIVLPLLSEHDLFGFVVLTRPKVDSSLTWEDRDLLITVGKQVAGYLERHNQAKQLMESSQFETFHRLSAFVMHDLKNLIAQQALVVKNATKHKNNPEFFEDAIHTISNSVNRMNGLLTKLQRNETAEIRPLELHKVLIEANNRCLDKYPRPTLRLSEQSGTINADKERFVMAITHLINNAQDATSNQGFIDIGTQVENGRAIITIADSGAGMSEEFVKTRLFKPFDSTKEGRGMGIGVYQANEIVNLLKGSMSVESTLGEGTTFTINLPINLTENS